MAFSHAFIRSSFFLGPHCLAVCVVAARKYGDEHLDLPHFGSRLVDYLQSVSGEIHIHLVTGAVLHMAYGVGLEHELPEFHPEGRTKVSVGMVCMILFVQLLDCHALSGEPCRIFRQQGFEPDLTFRWFVFPRSWYGEQFLQPRIAQRRQLFSGDTAVLIHSHIAPHRVPRDVKSTADAFYSHSRCVTQENVFLLCIHVSLVLSPVGQNGNQRYI